METNKFSKLRVCYFGIYNPNYSRNKELMKGLRENGVEIIECQQNPKEKYKYWKLFKKHRESKKYDLMIVGFSGQIVMPLAKLICRKPIVFDALVSLYDSNILDRKTYSARSLKALKYWFLDWLSCRLADIVLLDTDEHIKYFVKTFGIKRGKFRKILLGSGDEIFFPREQQKNSDQFLVHFHGIFIPLQGVEYMIRAAKILEKENIRFNLIGKGQMHQEAVNLSKKLDASNVNFVDFLPHDELVKYMAQADVCLGFFGNTPKAERCGAIKISEALAMRKPLVTANTPAIREFLRDRENCLLCNISDSEDLAKKILELKNNPELREKIAQNGYKVYQEKLTPKTLGKELKNILEELY